MGGSEGLHSSTIDANDFTVHVIKYLSPSLDLSLQSFSLKYADFRSSIAELDQRIGYVTCKAFNDCSGSEAVFKVKSDLGKAIFHGTALFELLAS